MMQRYFEINANGHNIFCKLYFNKLPEIKKVIVFYYGFAGHKDNGACEKFAAKVLSKTKTTAVLTFDWPCHGTDVKKKVQLQDCMTYFEMVIDYIHSQYRTEEIYAYGTSFGAYVLLKYIHEKSNPFRKIALRCPAIGMHDLLTGSIMRNGDMEKLQKGKAATVGFDRKVEVTLSFLEELQQSDIRQNDYSDFTDDMLVIHGTKDDVVPYEMVESFCDDNILELIPIEKANHRFQDPKSMELANKYIMDFYQL